MIPQYDQYFQDLVQWFLKTPFWQKLFTFGVIAGCYLVAEMYPYLKEEIKSWWKHE